MAKLHIPDPNEEGEDDLFVPFVFTYLVAAGIIFGSWYIAVTGEDKTPDLDSEELLALVEEGERRSKLLQEKQYAENLSGMSELELRGLDANELDDMAIWRFGSRSITEHLCQIRLEAMASGTYPEPRREALIRAIDRENLQAPWTCLIRALLNEELKDDHIRDAIEPYWQRALQLEDVPERIFASVLDDFRQTRNRPQSDEFHKWLVRCGLQVDARIGNACRLTLFQLAPRFGADILLMIEKGLLEGLFEVEEVVPMLGKIARTGQPAQWKIEETRELPDYDFDARLAAIFWLCRIVQGPSSEAAEAAAMALSRAGNVSGRQVEPTRVPRWRYACTLAFTEPSDQDNFPWLAVRTSEDPEDVADYTFAFLRTHGLCRTEENLPVWACGSDRWDGEGRNITGALANYFVETRFMEWE